MYFRFETQFLILSTCHLGKDKSKLVLLIPRMTFTCNSPVTDKPMTLASHLWSWNQENVVCGGRNTREPIFRFFRKTFSRARTNFLSLLSCSNLFKKYRENFAVVLKWCLLELSSPHSCQALNLSGVLNKAIVLYLPETTCCEARCYSNCAVHAQVFYQVILKIVFFRATKNGIVALRGAGMTQW